MTKKEIDKIVLTAFVKFLKNNDALMSYRANCAKYNHEYHNMFFPLHKTDCTGLKGAYTFICAAFSWGDTKQGHMFWSKLNRKWNELLTILERTGYEMSENIISTFLIKHNKE